MKKHFHWSKDKHNVIHLVFDSPEGTFNCFDATVTDELSALCQQWNHDDEISALIFTSGKPDFCLGYSLAAVRAWGSREAATAAAEATHRLFQAWTRLRFPTVAVIRGECLGSGLEWALAASWRLASDEPTTRLGLPEIQWGLIPGGGGSQRLPRLVGLQAGLDMILTGRKVSAKKALKSGLIDACVPASLLAEQALQFALRRQRGRALAPLGSTNALSKDLPKWAIEGNPIGRKVMFKKARDMIDDKTKGFYPASYKALEAVFDGYDLPLEQGCQLEASLFGQLLVTRQSQCLLHLYEASQKAARSTRAPSSGSLQIGVMGAGVMGGGIGLVCAERGIRVRLCDPNKQALGRALQTAHNHLARKVERRRIQSFEMQHQMALISPGLTPAGFKQCQLVIEAVPEDGNLKQATLAELEGRLSDDCVYASNTSAIPIAQIAQAARRPERVVGLHFFSPVEKMRLIEVVAGPQTGQAALEQAISFSQRLGKIVISVGDGPGFYTTRTLAFYLAEALQLLHDGATITSIDEALLQFGFASGPLALMDDIGLDGCEHVLATLAAPYGDRLQVPPFVGSLSASGRLGRKNGRGFYRYEEEQRREEDSELYKIVRAEARSNPETAQQDELIERCLLVFVNEAVACLQDGILQNPSDGDLGAVYGLGFPAVWGGPFKYIDVVGAPSIVENLQRLQEKWGSRFAPSPLLLDHAEQRKKFFPTPSAASSMRP